MKDDFNWEKVYNDFPVNSHFIWLNNCGTTPISTPVLNTVHQWLDEYSRRGTLAEGYGYATVKKSIYSHLESLIHAAPGELTLVHNTAEGINYLSHGLSLQSGDEILLLENEYPSNVYPWEHWREKGIELKFVKMGNSPESFLVELQRSLSSKTRVAAFSAVHWCTGMPLPLYEIGKLCLERDIQFIVDGSQGVGMVDIDVRGQGIGFMAFSAWKWLLGPVGVGMLFLAREKLEEIRPIFKGTESVVGDQQYLPYKEIFKPSAERFHISTGNMNDWIYFNASLTFLSQIGFARAQQRIMELARYLSNGLRNMGFDIASDEFGTNVETGIVAASKTGVDSASVVKILQSRKIIAAERLGKIRFSPHVYISFSQLDQVITELSAF